VLELLQEHELPLPAQNGAGESNLVNRQFVETLMHAADDESVRRLVEERAALVRSAGDWNGRRRSSARPRSKQQLELPFMRAGSSVANAAEFAAALRG
jgi:hypothetical protein